MKNDFGRKKIIFGRKNHFSQKKYLLVEQKSFLGENIFFDGKNHLRVKKTYLVENIFFFVPFKVKRPTFSNSKSDKVKLEGCPLRRQRPVIFNVR